MEHSSSLVQFISVAQSYLIPGDPMDHSMPGLPVHHQLPESTQTHIHWVGISLIQSLSHVRLFATPCTTARQASLSITNSRSPPKAMSIESVMPSNHLILCRPLLLPPSIFPSIRVFPNKSVLHIRWPKDWSFSFSISPSNEYSGLTSFRIDCLDLLAVQETLKSLLQYHSSKVTILRCSAFFILFIYLFYFTVFVCFFFCFYTLQYCIGFST